MWQSCVEIEDYSAACFNVFMYERLTDPCVDHLNITVDWLTTAETLFTLAESHSTSRNCT